jgi:hypothetical protein
MGRHCADCGDWQSNSRFSRNQWLKGDGNSRCKPCVSNSSQQTQEYTPTIITYQCHTCSREFSTQNQLNMHMQVHRPKTVACLICGEVKFKSAANAVQHAESGYCTGCRGTKENARRQIYDFATKQGGAAMNRYLTHTPMLEYGGGGSRNGAIPDFPYCCPDCDQKFRNLSQLMQHRDNKHNNRGNLIGY